MKKTHRILTLALSLILVLASGAVFPLSGFAEAEPVVLKMMLPGTEELTSLDTAVGKMIYEELGIELRIYPISNATRQEKANVMLAAYDWNDMDLIALGNTTVAQDYILSDALVCLDDYRADLENFFSYNEEQIPYWRTSDPNGGLYFWQNAPDMQCAIQPPFDIPVRTDVLEALGYPELQTTDDYVDFLKQALEMFPTTEDGTPTIGMAFGWGDNPAGFASYLVRHSGYQHFYKLTGMIDVENDCIISLIDNDYGKASFRFYNTLYREGLMDPEAFTSKWVDLQEKMNAGACICGHFMYYMVNSASQSLEAEGKDYGYVMMPIRLQEAEDDNRTRYELYTNLRGDETMGILASSKNIDACVKLLNTLCTEEYSLAIGRGVEGVDWNWKDDKIVMTDTYYEKINEEDYWYGQTFPAAQYFPIHVSGLLGNGQPVNADYDPDVKARRYTQAQQDTLKAYGWEYDYDGWFESDKFEMELLDTTAYIAAVVLDPDSEMGKLETKLIEYLKNQCVLCMTAETEEEFETRYAEMVEHANAMGAADLIAVYNENYKNISSKLEEYKNK